MSIVSTRLTIIGINIDVVYKDIKNLHIGVYPPLGRVRVAAPLHFDDERVRLAVIQRLPWIKRQREQLRSADRQTTREMVPGETHYVWGARRRLKVVERPGRAHFEVDGDRLVLYAPDGTSAERRRELLDQWYRGQLRRVVPDLIAKWERVLDVSVPRWSIRRMKTKWGSCNRETGHIWFNVELAKKNPYCLEYVVVHEMMHHLERNHGARFTRLMDKFMPNWRSLRDQLNNAPLAQEQWA
ncbi:metal-dependent hydrolase [Nocardiopsis terrae]|uniref:Metal-dependent hydrolase n=1 Tax=Nocardiopsis terrae TaxID=372655 RepID=A0ABR9HKE4_9ACTN|nr:SprT family zinc-dependent metalloprotease [Nocardiopsis terrae]MBE1459494.1 putative metal-dependent hydrolase [Nocardiopsis terrae]GHC95347.1 metal-dependent hydrolase [Nocardiopsis terrae]